MSQPPHVFSPLHSCPSLMNTDMPPTTPIRILPSSRPLRSSPLAGPVLSNDGRADTDRRHWTSHASHSPGMRPSSETPTIPPSPTPLQRPRFLSRNPCYTHSPELIPPVPPQPNAQTITFALSRLKSKRKCKESKTNRVSTTPPTLQQITPASHNVNAVPPPVVTRRTSRASSHLPTSTPNFVSPPNFHSCCPPSHTHVLSRNSTENWMSANPYEAIPRFSRLSLASPHVVLPLSSKEYKKRLSLTNPQPSAVSASPAANHARHAPFMNFTSRTSRRRSGSIHTSSLSPPSPASSATPPSPSTTVSKISLSASGSSLSDSAGPATPPSRVESVGSSLASITEYGAGDTEGGGGGGGGEDDESWEEPVEYTRAGTSCSSPSPPAEMPPQCETSSLHRVRMRIPRRSRSMDGLGWPFRSLSPRPASSTTSHASTSLESASPKSRSRPKAFPKPALQDAIPSRKPETKRRGSRSLAAQDGDTPGAELGHGRMARPAPAGAGGASAGGATAAAAAVMKVEVSLGPTCDHAAAAGKVQNPVAIKVTVKKMGTIRRIWKSISGRV